MAAEECPKEGKPDVTLEISERAFEEAIECALLRHGPDACPDDAAGVRESAPEFGDEPLPGGYLRRRPEDYDRGLCLIPADICGSIYARYASSDHLSAGQPD